MKNISKITGLILTVVFGCTSSSDSNNEDNSKNGSFIQGTIKGNINMEFNFKNLYEVECTGVLATYVYDEITGDKALSIGGVNTLNPSDLNALTISVSFYDLPQDGNFILGGIDESNSAGYEVNTGSAPGVQYITDEEHTGFFKITKYNESAQTVSGNFQFVGQLYNAYGVPSGKVATFTGTFADIRINDLSDPNNPKGPCFGTTGLSLNIGGNDESLPILTTQAVSNITSNGAISGGNITSSGNSSITSRGVCWSTTNNPTIALSTKTSNGTGIGSFTSNITGLVTNTIYYVRAFATNNKGTAYGNLLSFAVGTGTNLTIGMNYQGGKIAYFYKSGDIGYIPNEKHGIIISPDQVHTNKKWYNGYNIETFANNIEVGFGHANTLKIVNAQGNGDYAAKYCYDLVLNGYDDWYLPSYYETAILRSYFNPVVIGNGIWSSSELNSDKARYSSLTFNDGGYKSGVLIVIPIRSF